MKYALVTGAYGGMGYETTKLLASKGYTVFALDRIVKESEENVIPIVADFLDSESIKTAFEKVKAVASANGFATDMKAYKADPTAYPGNVSDVAEMLRIATTGLANTPDLWTIMQILGEERTIERLNKAIAAL